MKSRIFRVPDIRPVKPPYCEYWTGKSWTVHEQCGKKYTRYMGDKVALKLEPLNPGYIIAILIKQ